MRPNLLTCIYIYIFVVDLNTPVIEVVSKFECYQPID